MQKLFFRCLLENKENFKNLNFLKLLKSIILWPGLIIFSRIVPHPADFTPVLAFVVFSISQKKLSGVFILASWFISDILLSKIYHFSIILGGWSIFTYSGLIFIIILIKYNKLNFNLYLNLLITLLFWLWTNFGVWLGSNLYLFDINGLIKCYILSLPFLGNSILGTGLGYALIRIVSSFSSRKSAVLSV